MKRIVALITVIILLGSLFSLSGCLDMKNKEILDARIVEEISYFEIEERCGKETAELIERSLQELQSKFDEEGKDIDLIRKTYEQATYVIFNPDNRENLLWYEMVYYNFKEDEQKPDRIKYIADTYTYKPNPKKDGPWALMELMVEKIEIYQCQLTDQEVSKFDAMVSQSFEGHFEANYDRYTKYTYYFR